MDVKDTARAFQRNIGTGEVRHLAKYLRYELNVSVIIRLARDHLFSTRSIWASTFSRLSHSSICREEISIRGSFRWPSHSQVISLTGGTIHAGIPSNLR
jgi:hypothetical protein